MSFNKYSIIIAAYNDHDQLIILLENLLLQKKVPDETIIIDSSSNEFKKDILFEKKFAPLNIYYEKIKSKPPYSGKSFNYGVTKSNNNHIAFLDTKTIPTPEWLLEYDSLFVSNKYELIFGSTYYEATTFFQKILRSATYGKICHYTHPGTIITKSLFNNNKGFREDVRSGHDIEWKERMLSNKIFFPNRPYIKYNSLPKNFIQTLIKYSIYSFNTAKINIQNKMKDLLKQL